MKLDVMSVQAVSGISDIGQNCALQ